MGAFRGRSPSRRSRSRFSECRAALVSTSDVHARNPNAGGERVNPSENVMVGGSYCIDTTTPAEQLFSRQEHYDKYATHLDDVNSYFPISRPAREGGARRSRVHGSPLPRGAHLLQPAQDAGDDAPEVLRRLKEDEVDLAILTPV